MPSLSEQRRALESRMALLARERSTTLARIRRLIGFGVVCETLSEAVAQGIIPLFFVKGGVAIELRLGLRARATKDLDIGLCAPPEEMVAAFDRALEVGCSGFRLRRRGEARLLDNGARTLAVQIEYLGRGWATVDVDLAAATADTVTDDVATAALHDVGLGSARSVPCLTLVTQIAQKVHALTEPEPRGRRNTRARDVLDVLLLMRRLAPSMDELREACVQIFSERGMHQWPIYQFTFPAHWRTVIQALAQEVGYETTDPDVIELHFNDLLVRLNGVPVVAGFQYQFIILQYHTPQNAQDAALGSPIITNDVRYEAFSNLTKDGWRVRTTTEINRPSSSKPELLVLLERALAE